MKLKLQSANDVTNFDDPIEARRFVRGWVAKYKRITGKTVTFCDTNAGSVDFGCMTDDEAIFVAKDLHRMDGEAAKKK